jgi:hypothetical protein
LFIDDSPNMTMMEIRAKSRGLKQRHDLKQDADVVLLVLCGRRAVRLLGVGQAGPVLVPMPLADDPG